MMSAWWLIPAAVIGAVVGVALFVWLVGNYRNLLGG